MSGEWAIIPLTAQEEILLDDGVKRGGYSDREEYLFASLIHLIRNSKFDSPEKPATQQLGMVAEDQEPYNPRVEDEKAKTARGGENGTSPAHQ